MSDDSPQDLIDAISAFKSPDIEELSFDLISNHRNRTIRLLSNSGHVGPVAGRNRWFSFPLNEPAFISHIIVRVAGYNEGDSFNFRFTLFSGIKVDQQAVVEDSKVHVDVDNLCIGAAFLPPQSTSITQIESVTIYGFLAKEANKFLETVLYIRSRKDEAISIIKDELSNLELEKAAVMELRASRDQLSSEINQLKQANSREASKQKTLEGSRSDLIAKNEALKTSISQQTTLLSEKEARQRQLSNQSTELHEGISNQTAELARLKDDINLFPSEISGFARQGRKDVILYSLITAIPLTIIILMTLSLLLGAANLTTIIEEHPKFNLQALIASRAPYVTVSLAIITATYYISRLLILEIIRVNRQKLNLTKISIVAKDVSYSVENELNITDDQKYARRLTLKMSLMQEHLRDYISRDFDPILPEKITVLGQ